MIEILLFGIGICLGWKLREIYALRFLNKMLATKIEAETSSFKTINVRIERTEDMYYLYDADTDHFLVQGKTVDDMTPILQARFPNTQFKAYNDNIKEVDLK